MLQRDKFTLFYFYFDKKVHFFIKKFFFFN